MRVLARCVSRFAALKSWPAYQTTRYQSRESAARVAPTKFIQLGDGNRMPLYGIGTSMIDDEETLQQTLETAIHAGYRHIDTSFVYGNEEIVGNVLQKIFKSKLVTREDLFITNKLPVNAMHNYTAANFVFVSTEIMQLDYFDLYLIHCPMASKYGNTESEVYPVDEFGMYQANTAIDFVKTWREMERFRHDGFTKSIGLSNFNSKQIRRIWHAAKVPIANLQVECHAYLPQYELQEFCKELNITLTAYAPLGSPGFAKHIECTGLGGNEKERLLDDENLKKISEKHGKTPAQVLLRYLIERGIAVIPRSINPERIYENIDVFDFSLDRDDIAILKTMGKKKLRYFEFDFLKGMKEHPEYPFHIPF